MNRFGIEGIEVVVHSDGKALDRYFPVMGVSTDAATGALSISWIAGLVESEPKIANASETTPQIKSYQSGQWCLCEVRP